jgi:hypothetical protein
MYGESELRMMLGRLLDQLTQIEESFRAARELVQDTVYQIDANRTEPLPVTRDMIVAVMREAGNPGLARSDIIAAVHRDYGIQLPPNTTTTTLLRMQRAGLVWRDGLYWSLTN